jgi:SAM-dependent methyltransferase
MSGGSSLRPPSYVVAIREFFDNEYRRHFRYWWRGENRYSLDPANHTLFNAKVLKWALGRSPGRVLDVGAGEGADSIRFAKMGYAVDAIDVSAIACEKMERFARDERVSINITNESILTTNLSANEYDVVLMNGSLHYIAEKSELLERLRLASAPSALHAISLFSTVSPLPAEHVRVPVFPDRERGFVETFYHGDKGLGVSYFSDKKEESHPGFPEHSHSFIKFVTILTR